MNRLIAAAACLFAFHAVARAAELDLAHVAEDAKWVVHVDWESLNQSNLADRFREARPEKVEHARRWLKDRYGIDSQDGFKGMTFYGKSYEPHTGIAIVLGSYDKDKVTSLLEKQTGVERTEWNGRALYTYTKGGSPDTKAKRHDHEYHDDDGHAKKSKKPMHGEKSKKDKKKPRKGKSDEHHSHEHEAAGDSAAAHEATEHVGDARHAKHDKGGNKADKHHARAHSHHKHSKTFAILLYDDETVMMASTADAVKSAADLLEGNGASLEGSDSALGQEIPKGAIFYGAAVALDTIGDHGRSFPLLEQLKQITWAVGEHDDRVFDRVEVVARDAELAPHVQKLLEGFVAMGRVLFADSEKINELYDEAEFATEDDTVTVTWEGDADDVWAALEEAKPMLEKWHKAKHMRH